MADTLPTNSEPSPAAAASSEAPPHPLSGTFTLHSHPGATKVIYLDFDGHTTSGTQWNTSYTSGAPFTTPAFSLDGYTTFNDAEKERIQRIWQRVAEDFSPFDVDVTTQDPGVEALRDTGGGDNHWGIRVVIGGHNDDWFRHDPPAGGVAYIDSFREPTDTPCFVFADNHSGAELGIAEAASHEVGHTLGLFHDGTVGGYHYYEGHGTGATGWAPIMGAGYYQPLTQWSKGEYPNFQQYPGTTAGQDDLAVITTANGFGYRADDHGNANASASPLETVDGRVVSDSGVIEQNTDVDAFAVTVKAGAISLTIDPFVRGPNLDILAELYDSSGALVASSNPLDGLNAPIKLFATSWGGGTYYLHIRGTGRPATTGHPGYTNYGSLGQYTISGTVNDNALLTGDMNGDGTSDLVAVDANGPVAQWYWITSNGTGGLSAGYGPVVYAGTG